MRCHAAKLSVGKRLSEQYERANGVLRRKRLGGAAVAARITVTIVQTVPAKRAVQIEYFEFFQEFYFPPSPRRRSLGSPGNERKTTAEKGGKIKRRIKKKSPSITSSWTLSDDNTPSIFILDAYARVRTRTRRQPAV